MNDIDTVNVISFILGIIIVVCIILSIKLYSAHKRIDKLSGELEFAMIKLEKVDYILRIISNKFNNVDSEK
jgi:hypothetical protein